MKTRKILGITVIIGIILTMFFFISNDAAYLDSKPGIQRLFETLAYVCLAITVISGVVWFTMDGRK